MSIWDSIGKNFVKWVLGIIAACLIGLIGGGLKWYITWSNDEAAEDAEKQVYQTLMFDDPNQKEEIKDHVKEAIPALEQRLKLERDKQFQEQVLQELKQMRKMDTLNADQIYQIKEEIKQIEKGHN